MNCLPQRSFTEKVNQRLRQAVGCLFSQMFFARVRRVALFLHVCTLVLFVNVNRLKYGSDHFIIH